MSELIATRHLRASHVPPIDEARIDYGEDVRGQLSALWAFALTFDGYKYFGADDDVIGRLGAFAESVQRAHANSGVIPALGEIGMLRACLFYEQRNWCKWGKEMAEMTRDDVRYFLALAEAIRTRLS